MRCRPTIDSEPRRRRWACRRSAIRWRWAGCWRRGAGWPWPARMANRRRPRCWPGFSRSAGADPSFVFGAEYQDAAPGGGRGQGEWMIAEACEYRENFRHLRPEMAVLLAIEADHFDYYRSWRAVGRGVCPPGGDAAARGPVALCRRLPERLAAWPARPAARANRLAWGARPGRLASRGRAGGRRPPPVRRAPPWPTCWEGSRWRCREGTMSSTRWPRSPRRIMSAPRGERSAEDLAAFVGLGRRLETVRRGRRAGRDRRLRPSADRDRGLAGHGAGRCIPAGGCGASFSRIRPRAPAHLLDELATSLQNADKLVVAEIFRAREAAARPGEVRAADLARRAAGLGADGGRTLTRSTKSWRLGSCLAGRATWSSRWGPETSETLRMASLSGFEKIIRTGEPLAPHTWFQLGGPAEYFAEPGSVDELAALVRRCRRRRYSRPAARRRIEHPGPRRGRAGGRAALVAAGLRRQSKSRGKRSRPAAAPSWDTSSRPPFARDWPDWKRWSAFPARWAAPCTATPAATAATSANGPARPRS